MTELALALLVQASIKVQMPPLYVGLACENQHIDIRPFRHGMPSCYRGVQRVMEVLHNPFQNMHVPAAGRPDHRRIRI